MQMVYITRSLIRYSVADKAKRAVREGYARDHVDWPWTTQMEFQEASADKFRQGETLGHPLLTSYTSRALWVIGLRTTHDWQGS